MASVPPKLINILTIRWRYYRIFATAGNIKHIGIFQPDQIKSIRIQAVE